jgi:addiction module RelE/StbE family toxin
MEVAYKPSFLRQFKKLPSALQIEAKEKITLFKERGNHEQLRVHALKGKLRGYYSFSVNYQYRIVFMWEKQNTLAVLMAIGDHSVYE